jgi:hypothetical protein
MSLIHRQQQQIISHEGPMIDVRDKDNKLLQLDILFLEK